jgi:hypothetical protein
MSKGEEAKVYDYLYSLDYGLCHGPVDSINQVWVKDKPIFCGAIRARRNVCIELPELFGGDGKEGGVRGVLEAYMGDADQVASSELASREGLTPSTFPGYRGLAHLFFRGYNGTGFQWATNNYYLPAMKASITSVPKSLSAAKAFIWPLGLTPPDGLEDGDWNGSLIPVGSLSEPGPVPTIVTQRTGPRFHSSNSVMSGPQPEDNTDGAWFFGPAGAEEPTVEDCEIVLSARGYVPAPNGDQEENEPVQLDGELIGRMTAVSFTFTASLIYGGPYTGLKRGVLAAYLEGYSGGINSAGQQILGQRVLFEAKTVNITGEGTITVSAAIPSNVKYIRLWGTVVRTFPVWVGWRVDSAQSTITRDQFAYEHCSVDGTLQAMPDANPAHIIYECLTNPEWGKGETNDFIDVPSFLAAADTFYEERLGLSMMWNRQDTIESFVQEVLDHVKAVLFQSPVTGKWKLVPLRNDYTISSLPWLTPENCVVRNAKRRRWGETVNEITVSYTDPDTEEAATVTAHNLANKAIQGGTAAETRNYYGVRNPRLAQVLANRDVIEAGTPLWTATVEVDRSEWQIEPGDLRRLEWPDESIEQIVVRIMAVDYGKKGDRKIKLTVVEDIFSVAEISFTEPQPPLWQDDRVAPVPVSAVQFTSVPMPELMRFGENPAEVDEAGVIRLAVMADPESLPVTDIQTWRRIPTTTSYGLVAQHGARRRLFTSSPLAEEDTSLIPRAWIDALGSGFIQPGTRLMLGSNDLSGEVLVLVSFDPMAQAWTAARGMFDTVPKAWPSGTPLWHYPDGREFVVDAEFGEGNQDFRILPRTRIGRLPISVAPSVLHNVRMRHELPFRPANVQINNLGFGSAIYPSGPYPDIEVTWSNRNRLTEDVLFPPSWGAGTVTPEAGQTTRIILRSLGGAVIETYDDISGTSYTVPKADIGTPGAAWIEVYGKRGALISFQFSRRYVQLGELSGWSYDWGNRWGSGSLWTSGDDDDPLWYVGDDDERFF